MSAPPDSCPPHQNAHRMSGQNHQEQAHPPQPEQSSNVRHIPIFVEGRDEPVINKNVDHGTHFGEAKPTYAPPPQQPHIDREQYFNEDVPVGFHHPPNFSRAFGTPFNKGFRQGPQPFVQQKVYPQTAFARGTSPQRSQSPKPQPHPEEHFVKVPVYHEQAAPKTEPPSKPHQKPAQQPPPQAHPQPQQPPPQPQPKPQPSPANDPITVILAIQTDVLNLMTEVENFTGTKKDKKYMFLDEMLTRNLIKLDNIETDGKENIRQARKEAIKCIQKCIAVLEAKAEKGGSTPQPQDVDMKEETGKQQAEESNTNGEVEMKDATKDEPTVESQTAEAQDVVTELKEQIPDSNKNEEQPLENKEAQPQGADTQSQETKTEQIAETTQEEKKTDDKEEKKPTPKKGGKNVKKRDKSKDKKEVNKEGQEKKEDTMQIDEKGEKVEQNMEVDGASASQ